MPISSSSASGRNLARLIPLLALLSVTLAACPDRNIKMPETDRDSANSTLAGPPGMELPTVPVKLTDDGIDMPPRFEPGPVIFQIDNESAVARIFTLHGPDGKLEPETPVEPMEVRDWPTNLSGGSYDITASPVDDPDTDTLRFTLQIGPGGPHP